MQDLRIQASLQDNLSPGLNTITESLGRNKKAAESAKKAMGSLSGQINQVKSSFSSLTSALASGNFLGFGQNILGATTAIGGLTSAMGVATGAAGGLGSALTVALGPLGILTTAIAGLGALFVSSGKAAADLDKHLDSFQSLTGVDDSGIKAVSKSAIEMSKQFGTSAADIVDSMKLIGGQAPELLKDQEALESVTEAANVLAKAGEIEVVDAAKAITGTMNQMGASASQAKDIINTLAAGAKEGSYEIADLTEVFSKAGTMAKSSGMNFTELTALVEAVGGKFTEASVLGTSLNSTLIALSVQGNDKFKPAVVGMQQALDNLAAAELSDQEMKDLVGASNVKLLKSMIETKDEYTRLQGAITGTNDAYDMAAKNSDNLEGTMQKLKASWDALLITIGQSAIMEAIVKLFQMWADGAREVINTISGVLDELPKFSGGIGIFEALGAVIKVIGGLFKALWEIIGVGISVVIQIWNGLFYTVTTILKGMWREAKNAWDTIKKVFADNTIFNGFINAIKTVIRYIKMLIPSIDGIKKSWNELKRNLGMNVPEPKQPKQETTKTEDDNKGKGKGGTGKTKVKVEADKGSLSDLEKQLTDLQNKLKNKNLSLVDVEKTKGQIEVLKKQIEAKKIELGIEPKPGTKRYIEKQLAEIEAQLSELNPDIAIDNVEIQKLNLKKSELLEQKEKIEKALKPIEIEVVGKGFKSDGKEGSLRFAQDKVAYYQAKVNVSVEGTEEYDRAIEKLNEWKDKEEKIRVKIETDTSNIDPRTDKFLSNEISKLQAKLSITPQDTEEYYQINREIKALTDKQQIIKMKLELDTMEASEKFGNFIDGFNQITAPISSLDGLVGSFESLSKAIDEGANAWEVLMGVLDIVNQAFQTIQQTMQMVEFIEKLLGTTTQTTTAIQQTAAATTTVAAKSGESIASATASGAKMPFPLNLIAIAAGVAAVLSAFAMIGSFATGGIVGGNSYHGDKLTARVNSGEMILNGQQQKNLFNAINSGQLGGGNSVLSGEVKVKGSDLYIALKNYGKTKTLTGKNIGIH